MQDIYSGENFVGIILSESMDALKEFYYALFETESQLCAQLTENGPLLREYLQSLYRQGSEYTGQAIKRGMSDSLELFAMYAGVRYEHEEGSDHPFYPVVKYHFEKNRAKKRTPLNPSKYPRALVSDFLVFAAERYCSQLKSSLNKPTAPAGDESLYRRLYVLCGENCGSLEKLESLFKRQYYVIASLTAFLNTFTMEMMSSPTKRDEETCRHFFDKIKCSM